MPVSDEYQSHVRELLAPFEPLRLKRMFGGVGIYSDDLFFGILAEDQLYLKTDAVNRPDFERLGLQPFTHTRKDGRSIAMSYFPPPADALDDPEGLAVWVKSALSAARRAS
jgi:DNA transformation protein